MILSVMNHISLKLNQFLKNKFELVEDVVVVSNLVDHDGAISANVNNRVVIFLTNIERETAAKTHYMSSGVGSDFTQHQPVHLNLYLMVCANFSGANYNESLKFISSVVGYFQQQPVFNHQNSPDLDRNIDKIVLDIENVKNHDLSNMWGMFGAKYLPSILYKVRMITIDNKAVISRVSKTSSVNVSVKSESEPL
ncbi:DUF4255 domain-containing protein [Shewanella psychropiezotolerans]|uniref:DUF4255 domain-containing protein n=2 Tax=Shewanella TaxID=22 RepID=A0ABX5X2D5_9GAMM|nr:DUF4255 domain-containing protein [Shewanella psychropiezotolerans]MPY23421.1 DUF4255 domain-containing protein [Shewanella sp. YLB-07]QDO85504.1 DUF4255 domain-containing protein [Shewanella psychropiezotolerans]